MSQPHTTDALLLTSHQIIKIVFCFEWLQWRRQLSIVLIKR